jgi:hypothetical protein
MRTGLDGYRSSAAAPEQANAKAMIKLPKIPLPAVVM